jgi:hypothetical protein
MPAPPPQNLQLMFATDDPELGRCFGRSEVTRLPKRSAMRVRATLLAEQLLLEATRDWLRTLGLISYDAGSTRSDPDKASFGMFPFDLVAPSFARPLATPLAGRLVPGFVVGDVWLDQELSETDLAGHFRKTAVIRSNPKNRPFMSLLVASSFSRPAWKAGKSAGVLVTTPEILFGSDVAKALSTLVETLSRAAETAKAKPEVISQLFDRLGKMTSCLDQVGRNA